MNTRFLRWVGLGIGLASCVAVAWYAKNAAAGQDWSVFWSPKALLGLVWAGLLYASVVPLSSVAWKGLLGAMGQPHQAGTLVRILAVSQMAKYIPGNVANHVSRAALSTGHGIPLGVAVGSMAFEAVLAIAAAVGVATVGVLLEPSLHHVLKGLLEDRWSLVLLLGVLGVLLLAFLCWRACRAGFWRSLPLKVGAGAFSLYTLNYLLIGVGLWGFAALAFPGQAHHGLVLAAAFSLAWVVGFFTPGAPAGLGVREGLMLLFLTPFYDPATALFLVLGFRLATLAADLFWFSWGSWMSWRDYQPKRSLQ